ncbi:hypothetical protein GE09DRAFT_13380 [Coniochaeta sp. 2T2.1]|nr:hypothetical protein GE09DRAFT_13380 [Coniochaeta sp. 2T2.1]
MVLKVGDPAYLSARRGPLKTLNAEDSATLCRRFLAAVGAASLIVIVVRESARMRIRDKLPAARCAGLRLSTVAVDACSGAVDVLGRVRFRSWNRQPWYWDCHAQLSLSKTLDFATEPGWGRPASHLVNKSIIFPCMVLESWPFPTISHPLVQRYVIFKRTPDAKSAHLFQRMIPFLPGAGIPSPSEWLSIQSRSRPYFARHRHGPVPRFSSKGRFRDSLRRTFGYMTSRIHRYTFTRTHSGVLRDPEQLP